MYLREFNYSLFFKDYKKMFFFQFLLNEIKYFDNIFLLYYFYNGKQGIFYIFSFNIDESEGCQVDSRCSINEERINIFFFFILNNLKGYWENGFINVVELFILFLWD